MAPTETVAPFDAVMYAIGAVDGDVIGKIRAFEDVRACVMESDVHSLDRSEKRKTVCVLFCAVDDMKAMRGLKKHVSQFDAILHANQVTRDTMAACLEAASGVLQRSVACISGMRGKTRELQEKIAVSLGLSLTKKIEDRPTHLILGTAGGSKHIKAASNDLIHIVNETWLYFSLIGGQPEKESMCKVPLFLQLSICLTGFQNMEQRSKMKRMIESHGGKYMSNLTQDCSLLIAKTAQGDKFKFARVHKLVIVNEDWFIDCIQKRAYLDPADPKYEFVVSSLRAPASQHASQASRDTQGSNCTVELMRFSQSMASHPLPNDDFLECCVVGVFGFQENLVPHIIRLLVAGGASRCSFVHSELTHILVPNEDAWKTMQEELPPEAELVTLHWLLDSCTSCQCLPASDYPIVSSQRLSTVSQSIYSAQFSSADLPMSNNNGIRHLVFSGKSFAFASNLAASKKDRLRRQVIEHGGTVPQTTQGTDFVVADVLQRTESMPRFLDFHAEHASVPVNSKWIGDCISSKTFMDPWMNLLHLPLPRRDKASKSLFSSSFVVCISQFTGKLRQYIETLGRAHGASVVDRLRRQKTNVLLCHTQGSEKNPKLDKAIEWGIPVVSIGWLYDSILSQQCLGTAPYENLFMQHHDSENAQQFRSQFLHQLENRSVNSNDTTLNAL